MATIMTTVRVFVDVRRRGWVFKVLIINKKDGLGPGFESQSAYHFLLGS